LVLLLAALLIVQRRRNKKLQRESMKGSLAPTPPTAHEEEAYMSLIAPIPMEPVGSHESQRDTFEGKHIIRFSDLTVKRLLGSGAFGEVFLGEYKKTEVAIKKLSSRPNGTVVTQAEIRDFLAEAQTMKELPPHPNVVLFRGVCIEPLCIVTDYCNGGTLLSYMQKKTATIEMKLTWIHEIAKGMLHLHSDVGGKVVIHRDLAARNILLKDGHAVVADFGLARIKESKEDQAKTQTVVGPVKWEAPESLRSKHYSTKSDAFSFGVVIFEIISEEPPWKDINAIDAATRVLMGERLEIPAAKSLQCPTFIFDLMMRCFAQDPAKRPAFDEICDILQKGIQFYFKTDTSSSGQVHPGQHEAIYITPVPPGQQQSNYNKSPDAINEHYAQLLVSSSGIPKSGNSN